MSPNYDKLADYYDLEYFYKDDDIDFYLDAAREFGSPVLEIGIGTGRIALPLAEQGFTVFGVDNSLRMLKKAKLKMANLSRALQKNIHIIQADMKMFCLRQQFPLCVVPFRAFLHNLSQHEQISTLQSIRQHLQPDGMLVLDIFVPIYSVISRNHWTEEAELQDGQRVVLTKTRVDHIPAEQLLHVRNTYSSRKKILAKADYHYRYIFRFEMELLLKISGFQVLRVYGGFAKEPYSFYSGNMIFMARKIADEEQNAILK